MRLGHHTREQQGIAEHVCVCGMCELGIVPQSAKGSASWPPVRRRRAARLVRAGVRVWHPACRACQRSDQRERARKRARRSRRAVVSACKCWNECRHAGIHRGSIARPDHRLLPTCTSLTGRPGKRCCAAASASASSLPTTQRSMCSLGAPGLPRASASSSAAAASTAGAGQGHEQDERARLRRSMQFSCWTYRGVQLAPKVSKPSPIKISGH
jgi:hypothetical protein